MLVLLDEDIAQWYPRLFARLTVQFEHFESIGSDDVDVLADAVAELIGAIDDFAVLQGHAEPFETEPAPRAARPADFHGMKLRSQSELAIARALERASVGFFANPRGRIGPTPDARETREPDFLVTHNGKIGVLEVDGEDYHRGMAAQDHERDRLFRHQGIRVVERFPADRCFNMPDDVVAEFLRLLDRNG